MMRKKNDNIATIISITIVATVAVVTAIVSLAYIVYDKFIKLREIRYDPDIDGDYFEDSAESLETMIMDDEQAEI